MGPLKFIALSLALGLCLAVLFIGVGYVFVAEFPIVAVAFLEPALWVQVTMFGPDNALPGFGAGDEALYRTTLVIGFVLWWVAFTLLAAAILLLLRAVGDSGTAGQRYEQPEERWDR